MAVGREAPDPEAEIGHGIPDGVVHAVRPRNADQIAVLDDIEAAAAQERCELGRPFVDDDREALRVASQLTQAPGPYDRPRSEDHDVIADPLRLLEVVRRDHDVHLELAPDPADQRQHVVALERIEAVGRLVEENEGGIVHDRSGELHALPLPRRHRPDRPESLLAEPDLPESVVRPLDRRSGGEPVQLAEVPHEIGGVDVRWEVVVLRSEPDAGAHLDPGRRRIVPEHGELTGVAGAQAQDERDERRLPRSVRTEQARDAVPDVDIETVDRERRPVALRDAAGTDDRRGRGLPHSRALPGRNSIAPSSHPPAAPKPTDCTAACHACPVRIDADLPSRGAATSKERKRRPTVVLVGTLDTKGHEYAFLRDRIAARGVDVLLVDAGILGEPLTEPDVTRQEVATAVGADVHALAAAGDRAAAIAAMGRGVAEIVARLHADGRFDAIGALGGTGGTALATEAMRRLPIGVPKLMVSTVASGDTSSYVGSVDVTMMYSVADLAGINQISARIIANAAGSLAGMATEPLPDLDEARPLVAASMWGVTTPCVTMARARLEELGYDVLVFHQTGTGGSSMEELVKSGVVAGVLDVTPTELVGEIAGGVWPAGPDRLEGAGRLGIPQVVSLGGLDLIAIGPPLPLHQGFRGRWIYRHDDHIAAARTTAEESAELAGVIARKLNAATGPVALFVPLRGFSPLSTPGAEFEDAGADGALIAGLRELIDPSRVEVHERACDINDPGLAVAMAERLVELMTP